MARFPCGKIRYPTAAAAWRALRRQRQKHRNRQSVHRCHDCDGWYLTTARDQEPGKPRPRRPRWEPPPIERDEEELIGSGVRR